MFNFKKKLTCPIDDSDAKDVIVSTAVANQYATFAITDAKPYVLVVTLLTQENVKLLDQLEPGFKRTIDWNKCQFKSIDRKIKSVLGFLNWS